jgi:hypothetical protein
MLVSSRIGRRRKALVHARKFAGWVASSAGGEQRQWRFTTLRDSVI